MNLANNAAHLRGQESYDHAELDCDDMDAFNDAVAAEIESCWDSPAALADTFSDEGLKVSRDACALLARHREVVVSRGRRGRPLLPHEFALLAEALIEAIDPVIERDAQIIVERRSEAAP